MRMVLLVILSISLASAATSYLGKLSAGDTLGGVDYVPSETDLLLGFGDNASEEISTLAQNGDPGVRIRAYRALGSLSDEYSMKTLKQTIEQYNSAIGGVDVLYLRAAIEAIASRGAQQGYFDQLISHPLPDVRAEVARALADGEYDQETEQKLRLQRSRETVTWVKWEIEKSLLAWTSSP